MKRDITTRDQLITLYPELAGDIVRILCKYSTKQDELLKNVEFHFGGKSYRVFARFTKGSLQYIMGKPGIYLQSDASIHVDDDDAIFVSNNDPSILVIPDGTSIFFACPYKLQTQKLTNQENRGWNEDYFIVTCNGSALEKRLQGKDGADIVSALQKVASDYRACFDFESSAMMHLSSDAFDLYSAKPFAKTVRANHLPSFKDAYETWKKLTENNNSGSWYFMAYDFRYHGSAYRLTCGNLVEYDLFYREANEKIRQKLENMGAKDITFVSSKAM